MEALDVAPCRHELFHTVVVIAIAPGTHAVRVKVLFGWKDFCL